MNPTGTNSRRQFIITCILAVVILVPSLWGFGTKFIEFIALFRSSSDGVFAISPIMNYLLAGLGFFCLLCWGMAQGMFTDVERPKYTMLQTEHRLDEAQQHHPSIANASDHKLT
ncbi:hypothetical protein CA54_20430 [Symmachiella macrocystis]|uniref:Uncharacterized protein n=1 Tax=Symmachiella macrocystis TaxID=2527985 RepID=A0A5C6BP86_9PLAN|nr:hypothetical protein [Symmachiella macrocystis]TWU13211.1 hypothetical protein CA54_20430 [Symmachiella macrocystis]